MAAVSRSARRHVHYAAAVSPQTPAENLAALARDVPVLRPLIIQNPSIYPELREWLLSLDDPQVRRAWDVVLANSPDTDATTLQSLAVGRPELRSTLVSHPQMYPELREWILAQSNSEQSVRSQKRKKGQSVFARTFSSLGLWITIAAASLGILAAVILFVIFALPGITGTVL